MALTVWSPCGRFATKRRTACYIKGTRHETVTVFQTVNNINYSQVKYNQLSITCQKRYCPRLCANENNLCMQS